MAPHPDDSPDRVRLEVGLQLRFHRHRAGLSQTQVVAATGWSLSAISMYEQGNRQAGYAKLRRLAELYGCTVDDFFNEQHAGFENHRCASMNSSSADLGGRTRDRGSVASGSSTMCSRSTRSCLSGAT